MDKPFLLWILLRSKLFYTKNVINVTIIGHQISELMFLWWPAILYSVLNSVC